MEVSSKRFDFNLELRLCKFDEVLEYQKSNPYIRTGYRPKLHLLACLKSVFQIHNETINIWSHLLGFLVFLFLLFRDFVLLPSHFSFISFTDMFILFCMLLCYLSCMLCSVVYHTFACHSKRVAERCLSFDMAGITLALLATYLSGIYYAFWCHTFWRDFYLLTVGGIFLVAAGVQISPKFCADEFASFRIGLFALWAVYGVIPTIHWVWLHGGFHVQDIVPVMLPRIFVMYLLCGLGFVFYATKIPERLFPGLMDIIGHSHQLWHVFTFGALLFWHQTGVNFALFRLATGCSNQNLSEEIVKDWRIWPF